MSTTIRTEDQAHPIARFSGRLHRVLDGLAEAPAWSMTPDEQRTVVVGLARAEARLAELRLRVLAAADRNDVAADSAATSTGAWLAQVTRRSRGAAHAEVALAVALDTGFSVTRDALAAGRVDVAQAAVIVRSIQALPQGVSVVDRGRTEAHLVRAAGEFDAAALKVLGRRVLEVIDPDAADLAEGARLEAEEAAAARATFLQLSANPDGSHTGRFKIPALHAAMLTKMLHAFTNPRHQHQHQHQPNSRVRLSRPERLGEAFCRLLERVPADRLPSAGGMSATVVVLLDYDQLLSGLGTATLDTGQPLSAGAARQLACEAGIVPAVWRRALGSPSVVLDLGRRTRLHTEAQRTALTIRDRGCTTVGCDRPAAWCHAHHDQPWSQGGPTSVVNGRLLCAFHHGKAHSLAYVTSHLPTGQIQFHRRT
ncbi:HNH endonuclease [Nocardioides panacis]|uniref:HNH endonuclease n=1 Tax=Nocardioides panacis TaxID=2849501 RepID=A0A975Y1J7_9ACTN|nr:HNH endonuclease signature motif containing protein [Nocardioides panacis]QWZ09469.1 HNH endonuclease [Nocardioides panacis]